MRHELEKDSAQPVGAPAPVPEPDTRMTVRDVLDLGLVRSWAPELVAGAAGLDQQIRWVHVAEAGDVAAMLRGGEVVLTTGVLLAGDGRVQTDYIEAMHRAGAAAVVLGLGRAFSDAPPAMRRAAERCGLPLIVLRRPAPFARLTEEVHTRLIHWRFAALDVSDRVRSALAALNLEGAPIQRILDEVAAYGRCPVAVVNLTYRLLASAGDGAALADLITDWDRVSRQVAADPPPIPGAPDGWVVVPLAARGERWGSVVLFGLPADREHIRMLADLAAEALAMHRLLAGGAGPDWEAETAGALLADLVSGTAPSARLTAARLRAAGLPVDRRVFVPLVVRLDSGTGTNTGTATATGTDTGTSTGGRSAAEPVQPLADRVLKDTGLHGLAAHLAPTADRREGTAVLLSLPQDASEPIDAAVDRFGRRFHDRIARHDSSVLIGAGPWCTDLARVQDAFVEAECVADAAMAEQPRLPVHRLRNVRLRGLVRMLRDEPALQSYIERELGPLLGRPDLLTVLRTYLRSGGNKSHAAKQHHFSRPALYRRLREIETALDIDLEDWDQLTALHVAVLAHDAQSAAVRPSEQTQTRVSPAQE